MAYKVFQFNTRRRMEQKFSSFPIETAVAKRKWHWDAMNALPVCNTAMKHERNHRIKLLRDGIARKKIRHFFNLATLKNVYG